MCSSTSTASPAIAFSIWDNGRLDPVMHVLLERVSMMGTMWRMCPGLRQQLQEDLEAYAAGGYPGCVPTEGLMERPQAGPPPAASTGGVWPREGRAPGPLAFLMLALRRQAVRLDVRWFVHSSGQRPIHLMRAPKPISKRAAQQGTSQTRMQYVTGTMQDAAGAGHVDWQVTKGCLDTLSWSDATLMTMITTGGGAVDAGRPATRGPHPGV